MKFNAGLTATNTSAGGSASQGFGNVFMEIKDNMATVNSNTTGLGTITGIQIMQNDTTVIRHSRTPSKQIRRTSRSS